MSSECRKPVGVFCRLHSDRQVNARFSSVEDVFARFDGEASSLMLSDVSEVRCLGSQVPELLEEHERVSALAFEAFSAEDKLVMTGYSGFAAGVMNSVLLGHKYEYYDLAPDWRDSGIGPCDFNSRGEVVDYMENLDRILESVRNEKRVLYRGIPIYSSLHDEIGASVGESLRVSDSEGMVRGLREFYKPGKVVSFDTYLSTSLSAGVAAERTSNTVGTKQSYYEKAELSGIVFEIESASGLDITGAARHNSYEREVVLPRGSSFRVKEVFTAPPVYRTETAGESESFAGLAAVVQLVEISGSKRVSASDVVPR